MPTSLRKGAAAAEREEGKKNGHNSSAPYPFPEKKNMAEGGKKGGEEKKKMGSISSVPCQSSLLSGLGPNRRRGEGGEVETPQLFLWSTWGGKERGMRESAKSRLVFPRGGWVLERRKKGEKKTAGLTFFLGSV